MIQQICRALLASVSLISPVFGQEDSLIATMPYKLSIQEDILNLKVQSAEVRQAYAASRKNEDLSQTNVSTYLITANDIKQSGALTIAEALRLVPGLLVKQSTNGYFHVSVRGASPVAMQRYSSSFENTSLLLTINGIPFNNGYQGGILWETIPVDLNDIAQIEVITVPSTVFFGPNASSGVINLVTEGVEENVLRPRVSLQGGLNGNYAHRGSASFGLSNRLRFRVSGHYNRLARWQEDFYLHSEQRYVPADSLLYYQSNARETNVSAEKALHNNGINATVIYQPNAKVNLETLVSMKESYLQSVLQPLGIIALSNRDTETSSTFAIRAQTGNIRTNVAYSTAKQNLAVGYQGLDIRTNTLFASTEYDYQSKYYSLKIGGDVHFDRFSNALSEGADSRLLLASTSYQDRVLPGNTSVLFNGAFLSQHLCLLDNKWRLFAALRADRFDVTKQFYGSYRLGSTYQIGKIHALKANISEGLGSTFATSYHWYNDSTAAYQANRALNPTRVRSFEMSYRVTPRSDLTLEAIYYQSLSYNLVDPTSSFDRPKTNSNEVVVLNGITIDARWTVGKIEANAFLTTQHPLSKSAVSEVVAQSITNHFGGFTVNYSTFLNKLKIGASAYYYGASTIPAIPQNFAIGAKAIANCKVAYNFWDEHVVFLNARNAFNSRKVEFPFSDQTNNLYLIGVDLTF